MRPTPREVAVSICSENEDERVVSLVERAVREDRENESRVATLAAKPHPTVTSVNDKPAVHMMTAADWKNVANGHVEIARIYRANAENAARLPPHPFDPARAFLSAREARWNANAAKTAADAACRLPRRTKTASGLNEYDVSPYGMIVMVGTGIHPDAYEAKTAAMCAEIHALEAESAIDRWSSINLVSLTGLSAALCRHPQASVRRATLRAFCAVDAWFCMRRESAPTKVRRELGRAIVALERQLARYFAPHGSLSNDESDEQ